MARSRADGTRRASRLLVNMDGRGEVITIYTTLVAGLGFQSQLERPRHSRRDLPPAACSSHRGAGAEAGDHKVNREVQHTLTEAGHKGVISILDVRGALTIKEVLTAHVVMRQAVRPYPRRQIGRHRVGPGPPTNVYPHAHPGDERPVGSRPEILVV